MRKLYPSHGALLFDEIRDSPERLNVRVGPQSEIAGRNSSLGRDCGCFDEYEACATDSAAAQVDKVPIVGEPVLGRILAHRRDTDAVRNRYAPDGQGRKQRRLLGDRFR